MKNWMIALGGFGLAVAVITGCSKEEEVPVAAPSAPASTAPAAAAAGAALPASLIATTQPVGEVLDVAAAKKTAKAGDKIVVRGKVAGSVDPLADNRAMLTLLDANIKTCDAMPGDACKTPWDACCEPADVLAANTATVQVVDADGKPLKATLDGAGGLKPLKQVVVAGVAKQPAGSDVLVIEASEIYVQP